MEHNAKATLRPPRRRRAVALVGFGDSHVGVQKLSDDIPVWSLNDAPAYGVERFDVIFDMHPLRDVILEKTRWDSMQSLRDYPIYTLSENPELPSTVKYPLDDALRTAFEFIHVGDEHARYVTSTFGYMLILAVMEGYDDIYLFGFEFLSDTEHVYQAIGAALLIGWAAGCERHVYLPEDTPLIPHTLYGYEDYQMISRQNIEQTMVDIMKIQSEQLGRMNGAHAQVIERMHYNLPYRLFKWLADYFARHSRMNEVDEIRNDAYKQMYMAEGAMQILRRFIGIIDRKERELNNIEFADNYFVVEHDE